MVIRFAISSTLYDQVEAFLINLFLCLTHLVNFCLSLIPLTCWLTSLAALSPLPTHLPYQPISLANPATLLTHLPCQPIYFSDLSPLPTHHTCPLISVANLALLPTHLSCRLISLADPSPLPTCLPCRSISLTDLSPLPNHISYRPISLADPFPLPTYLLLTLDLFHLLKFLTPLPWQHISYWFISLVDLPSLVTHVLC